MSIDDQPGLAQMRCSIEKRIAPYCQTFSPAEFAALVEKMARIQYKYENAFPYKPARLIQP